MTVAKNHAFKLNIIAKASIAILCLIAVLMSCYKVIEGFGFFDSVSFTGKDIDVVERYLGMNFPASVEKISVCYSYDASLTRFGVAAIVRKDDLPQFQDEKQWSLFKGNVADKKFPTKISVAGVGFNKKIKCWDPCIDEIDQMYVRAEENKETILFIEKEHKAMRRVFIIVNLTAGKRIPYSMSPWFETSALSRIM